MPKASGKPNQHFVVDRWFDILKGEPPRMVAPLSFITISCRSWPGPLALHNSGRTSP